VGGNGPKVSRSWRSPTGTHCTASARRVSFVCMALPSRRETTQINVACENKARNDKCLELDPPSIHGLPTSSTRNPSSPRWRLSLIDINDIFWFLGAEKSAFTHVFSFQRTICVICHLAFNDRVPIRRPHRVQLNF
jgi:hypothetical protein